MSLILVIKPYSYLKILLFTRKKFPWALFDYILSKFLTLAYAPRKTCKSAFIHTITPDKKITTQNTRELGGTNWNNYER